MAQNKKKHLDFFTKITPEQRDSFVLRTHDFIKEEYDVAIGNFDLEELLELFLEEFGSAIYNQGSDDMKSFLQGRFNDSLDDSYTLGID